MSKRSLEELQKQYSRASGPDKRGPGGPGHGPRGGPGMRGPGGKPKNSANTIRRMLQYIRPYWAHLLAVLLCMLLSTVTALAGSYLTMPIINRLGGIPTEAKDGVFAVFAETVTAGCAKPKPHTTERQSANTKPITVNKTDFIFVFIFRLLP